MATNVINFPKPKAKRRTSKRAPNGTFSGEPVISVIDNRFQIALRQGRKKVTMTFEPHTFFAINGYGTRAIREWLAQQAIVGRGACTSNVVQFRAGVR